MQKIYTPHTVGIIGGKGRMGQKFQQALTGCGMHVIVADVDTPKTNRDVAAESDVVIVSVPIRYTEHVLRDIAPVMQAGSLLTDLTSVKILPMTVMQERVGDDVGFVGGHPLFAPSTDWKKQHFILCEGAESMFTAWYRNFLLSLGLEIIDMSAVEHDRHMAIIQCLTHFSNVALGSALEKLHYDLHRGEKISTSVYKMRLYGVGRILAQDPMLYADIQKFNPYAKEVSEVYLASVQELCASITDGDGFVEIFKRDQKYFGDFTQKSLQITDQLIKTMNKYE